MTPLQYHPYPFSLLTFLIGGVLVSLFGRPCSRMSRSNMYALCLYYVSVFSLSSFILFFGIRYGYIRVERDGKFEGVLGLLIENFIVFMGDTYLPASIFFFDVAFTVVGATLIFILAGLTNSLPRRVKMMEPFSRVFLKRGETDRGRAIQF